MIYQLGIAGFCFANIMLMSFPEYLGIDASEQGFEVFFAGRILACHSRFALFRTSFLSIILEKFEA